MRLLALIAGTSVLTGCAVAARTDPATVSAWKTEALQTLPKCKSDKECEVKWAAARQYVLEHSAWKIQHMTSDFIETFSPPTGQWTLGWQVTKKPMSDGSYAIETKVWCGTTYTECEPPNWQALRDFNRAVNAAWKQP